MKIYKMKDFSDKFSTDKKNIPSLPFRICAIGKTGSGKSGILGNILLRKDFYRDDFKPENIFIFSGSLQGDHKLKMMIEQLEIPDSNCFSEYDEDIGNTIYDMLVDNYNEKIDMWAIGCVISELLAFTDENRSRIKDPIMFKGTSCYP